MFGNVGGTGDSRSKPLENLSKMVRLLDNIANMSTISIDLNVLLSRVETYKQQNQNQFKNCWQLLLDAKNCMLSKLDVYQWCVWGKQQNLLKYHILVSKKTLQRRYHFCLVLYINSIRRSWPDANTHCAWNYAYYMVCSVLCYFVITFIVYYYIYILTCKRMLEQL